MTEEDEEDWDEAADGGICKVSRGIPMNSPVQVLIRVYVVSVRARSPSAQKSFQDLAKALVSSQLCRYTQSLQSRLLCWTLPNSFTLPLLDP